MTTIVDLIPVLLQKTKDGKIAWEALAGESFIARVGENSVEAGYTKDGTERLALLDLNGRRLESVDWSTISAPLDKQLSDLVEIARRKALRIDEIVKDVKAHLDRL